MNQILKIGYTYDYIESMAQILQPEEDKEFISGIFFDIGRDSKIFIEPEPSSKETRRFDNSEEGHEKQGKDNHESFKETIFSLTNNQNISPSNLKE